MFNFEPHSKETSRLCKKFGIKKLEFFGSVLSDDFNDGSDIDCLIEFDETGGNHFHGFFDLKYALEELFGRDVDLVVDSAIRNPYFRAAIDSSRRLVDCNS